MGQYAGFCGGRCFNMDLVFWAGPDRDRMLRRRIAASLFSGSDFDPDDVRCYPEIVSHDFIVLDACIPVSEVSKCSVCFDADVLLHSSDGRCYACEDCAKEWSKFSKVEWKRIEIVASGEKKISPDATSLQALYSAMLMESRSEEAYTPAEIELSKRLE